MPGSCDFDLLCVGSNASTTITAITITSHYYRHSNKNTRVSVYQKRHTPVTRDLPDSLTAKLDMSLAIIIAKAFATAKNHSGTSLFP